MSKSFALHILAPGHEPSDTSRILVGSNLPANPVQWQNERILKIDIRGARIYQFRNFWQPANATETDQAIRIILLDEDSAK